MVVDGFACDYYDPGGCRYITLFVDISRHLTAMCTDTDSGNVMRRSLFDIKRNIVEDIYSKPTVCEHRWRSALHDQLRITQKGGQIQAFSRTLSLATAQLD